MSSKSNPAGGKFNPKYLPKIQKFFSKNECPKWNDLETFEREKKSLLRTNNFSNIAKYFEINDNGDRFEFLMESWEWGSLRDVYSSPKYIYTMNLVLDWSKQLFSALGYLNCRNILQQDICPENVIMTGDFSLKLAYFPTIPNLIGGQRYEGVEKYGRAEWDESFKNQVYSIGLIIWEIIERRRVFEEYDRDGKFQVDQLHQDLKTGKFLLPWPKCESRLAVIVELCTRLNLDDRPGSSDAFDLPYSKISQHASNKKEPQALKMKIREDERCLIRPIGFDGTENEDNPKVSRNPQKRHVILYFDGEVE
ncbi:unnamed protein product, partial [Mesorhabditis belari]|uniref:Protein kinase domain-containing protein n=1 Tax=Mesorhabditis belari TaxID=2138241 RepID=A0AAF3FDL1_9BILA